jgi:hypothetical protein
MLSMYLATAVFLAIGALLLIAGLRHMATAPHCPVCDTVIKKQHPKCPVCGTINL